MNELLEARNKADKEMILQVDRNNNVIGHMTRREMAINKLYFRGSSILVFNSKNQLHVQKRVMTKRYCPGYFDNCIGGIVGKDESDEDSAYRELKEELEIDLLEDNKKLKYHGCFRHNTFWGNIYSCVYDGDVTIQTTEIDSIHYRTIEEIRQEVANGALYRPDSLTALNHFIIERDLHDHNIIKIK